MIKTKSLIQTIKEEEDDDDDEKLLDSDPDSSQNLIDYFFKLIPRNRPRQKYNRSLAEINGKRYVEVQQCVVDKNRIAATGNEVRHVCFADGLHILIF